MVREGIALARVLDDPGVFLAFPDPMGYHAHLRSAVALRRAPLHSRDSAAALPLHFLN
jgi:hypothetical protein